MAAAPQGDQESLTTVIGDEKQIIAAPDHSQEPSSNEITTAFKQQESGLPDDLEVIIITPTASTETAVAVKEVREIKREISLSRSILTTCSFRNFENGSFFSLSPYKVSSVLLVVLSMQVGYTMCDDTR